MDARIKFDSSGLRQQLREAQAAASDLTPLMDEIGKRLSSSARDRITESNESPDGVPWPKSFRVIAGQGGKTLFEGGTLRNSITHRAARDEAEIGSNLIYAAVHQFGATITAKTEKGLAFRLADGSFARTNSVTIPARPYLGVSRADEQLIEMDLIPAHWSSVLADV